MNRYSTDKKNKLHKGSNSLEIIEKSKELHLSVFSNSIRQYEHPGKGA